MKIRMLALLGLIAVPMPLRAAPTREGGKISLAPAAYPAEAQKKGVAGNVVLTGEVTAEGKVAGLQVLASSSPLLTDAAVRHIQASKFGVSKENGKPTQTLLNVVVRFRNDRAKPGETGSMPAPMIGNFAVMPAAADGRPAGPEGFAIEGGDRGVRGELDIDLPHGSAGKSYRLKVTDRFPGGRNVAIMDKEMSPTAGGSSIGALIFRPIDPARREEQGLHTLDVTVDGKSAGGARYLVARAAAAPARRAPTRKK